MQVTIKIPENTNFFVKSKDKFVQTKSTLVRIPGGLKLYRFWHRPFNHSSGSATMWPFGNLDEIKTKVKLYVISMKCIDWALILGAIWILYQQNLKLQENLDKLSDLVDAIGGNLPQ